MSANLTRNFKSELNAFATKNVVVHTTNGKEIRGVLLGINPEDLSLILGDAVVDNTNHHRIFLSGQTLAQIYLGEAPFDISGLRTELEKVFKKSGVRYYDDTRTIMVMDRFKVTEEAVEGEGPIADRIRMIWSNYKESPKPATEEEPED